MRRRGPKIILAALIACLPLSLLAKKPWKTLNDPTLADAPAKARSLENPYAGKPEAVQAGKKLYARHCASCHGEEARGRDKAPSLRSSVVGAAAPGALFWFLKNGSLKKGMPAWSRLPDQQIWQLVSYLQTLREHPDSP
jgi:mono/diheme cytochrome c family protein